MKIMLLWSLLTVLPLKAAEVIPLEEKTRFDRALEDKAEEVLVHLLGPGRAKVTVDATIDFSTVESMRMEGEATPAPPPEGGIRFLWEDIDKVDRKGYRTRLLPGIPSLGGQGAAGRQDYERKVRYPTDYVKRLAVTLILDKSIGEERTARIEGTVRNVLDVDPSRGDTLKVIAAEFSTPWRNLWQSAESAQVIVKYGVLVSMSMIALLVVGYCFIRLASAMSDMAQVQLHQIRMDLPQPAAVGGPDLLAPPPSPPRPEAPTLDAEVELELRPEHLEGLPVYLASEASEELATAILFQLTPEQEARVLGSLPESLRQALLVRIADTVRLDPELAAEARDSLRRFAETYVAGRRRLHAALARVPDELQGKMIGQLEEAQPGLAKELKSAFVRFEGLADLPEEDRREVLARVPDDRLALALRGVEEPVQEALLGVLPAARGEDVNMRMNKTPPQPMSRVREARRWIVESWKQLAERGRVSGAASDEPMI